MFFHRSNPSITIGTRGIYPFDWPFSFSLWPLCRFYRLTGDSLKLHHHIMGKSGQGKSFYVAKAVVDLISQGVAVSVLDPHSDLANDVLRLLFEGGYFNRHGFEKVWYIDLSRRDRFLPFNMLKQYDGKGNLLPLDVISENIKLVLQRFFPAMADGAAPVFENIVQYAAIALAANGLCLPLIEEFLTVPAFRAKVLANCSHFPTRNFFHNRFDHWPEKKRAEDIESTLNKISIITLNEPILYSLLQLENRLNFRYIIDNGISVICNLGNLPERAQKLAGCFYTVGYEQAALSRGDMAPGKRRMHILAIDEFASFSTPDGTALSKMLSQTRKFNLFTWLIHQTWEQLPESLQAGIQNVGVELYFGLGYQDSLRVSPLVGRPNPYHKKHEPRALQGQSLPVEHNPVYFQQQEEQEAWTRRIEDLWDREVFVKRKRKLPRLLQLWMKPHAKAKIRTLNVPHQTCSSEALQKIKDYYANTLMKTKAEIIQNTRNLTTHVLSQAALSTRGAF